MLGCTEKRRPPGRISRRGALQDLDRLQPRPPRSCRSISLRLALGESAMCPAPINAFRAAIRRSRISIRPTQSGLAARRPGTGRARRARVLALVNFLPMINGDSVTYKTMALETDRPRSRDGDSDTAAKTRCAIPRYQWPTRPRSSSTGRPAPSGNANGRSWPNGHVKRARLTSGSAPVGGVLHDDPLFQLRRLPIQPQVVGFRHGRGPPACAHPPASDKLRIRVVSSDLRGHAVGFAMTTSWNSHDREKCEIFAYYCGVRTSDARRRRESRTRSTTGSYITTSTTPRRPKRSGRRHRYPRRSERLYEGRPNQGLRLAAGGPSR